MQVLETALPGVVVITPRVHRDPRGFFLETWRQDQYEAAGIPGPFVQDNHSRSVRGTLRGLHWQDPRPQGKLVRAVEGEIYDVAVDIRPESPTFGRWIGVYLSAENFQQCYVPPGFAHGFCVVSEWAQVQYKCTDFYAPEHERGLLWNDPAIGIDWPVDAPVLSGRDQAHPTLEQRFGRRPSRG
jgi:dTDP-4-dehydrorhamnose 3,5-epimerase